MELKLNKAIRLKWLKFTSESQTKPTQGEMLKFLSLQHQHFESMSSEWKPQTCVACNRGNHALSNCIHFRNMTCEERWDIVKKYARCKNCLKPRHKAFNCRAPPLCRKCLEYHHSVMHIAQDPKTEETKKKDLMYAAPL